MEATDMQFQKTILRRGAGAFLLAAGLLVTGPLSQGSSSGTQTHITVSGGTATVNVTLCGGQKASFCSGSTSTCPTISVSGGTIQETCVTPFHPSDTVGVVTAPDGSTWHFGPV